MPLTLTELSNIERLVGASRLTEVRIEQDGKGVTIAGPDDTADFDGQSDALVAIAAPAVGTLSLGKTRVGRRVSKDDPIAKLKVLDAETPVRATANGRVAALLAKDGDLVAYGDELILIEPEGTQ